MNMKQIHSKIYCSVRNDSFEIKIRTAFIFLDIVDYPLGNNNYILNIIIAETTVKDLWEPPLHHRQDL
jgi:hypothetical protein